MREPLPYKEIPIPEWFNSDEEKRGYWNAKMRLLFFDPAEVFKRIDNLIDPYRRHQTGLSTAVLFPKRSDGICRCGCGQQVKKMWASEACSNFAYRVYDLITYGTSRADGLIRTYYGDKCACGKDWKEIDHIIPVKYGGGGCWISNFIPLCKACHRDKTNKDFGFGKYKVKPQLSLELKSGAQVE